MQRRCTSWSKVSGFIVIGRNFEVVWRGHSLWQVQKDRGCEGMQPDGFLAGARALVDAKTRGTHSGWLPASTHMGNTE